MRCEGTEAPKFSPENPPVRLLVTAPAGGVRVRDFWFAKHDEPHDVTPDEATYIIAESQKPGAILSVTKPGDSSLAERRALDAETDLIDLRRQLSEATTSLEEERRANKALNRRIEFTVSAATN